MLDGSNTIMFWRGIGQIVALLVDKPLQRFGLKTASSLRLFSISFKALLLSRPRNNEEIAWFNIMRLSIHLTPFQTESERHKRKS